MYSVALVTNFSFIKMSDSCTNQVAHQAWFKSDFAYCAAQERTVEKIPDHCNCLDQKTWYSTRQCAFVKAEVKCFIACHGGTNQDDTSDCPNISSMAMRTQRGHRTRDQELETKEAKRL